MKLSILPVGEEYNQQMLDILLDSPMETDGLTLCFDRSPDIFSVPALFFREFKAFGFFLDDRLVGYAMICRKNVYVNGLPREIGYLANLYVRPEARKRGWLYKASESLFREALEEVGFGFALTVKGNRNTETMIGRRIMKFPWIPHSAITSDLEVKNILITFQKRVKHPYRIRRASEKDIPAIAALLDREYQTRLFGTICTEAELEKIITARPGFHVSDYYLAETDGRIVGVCSAWDISKLRKVRVMAYRGKYRWVRFLYGIVAPLFRFPPLPLPGEAFREITLNDYAVENRDPLILEALLIRIYRDYRKMGYNMLQIASYTGDPLLSATRRFYSQPVFSRIILGSGDPDLIDKEGIDCSRPYIDIALT
jgi:hypothetical protein